MKLPSKTRGDSVVGSLPPERQKEIADYAHTHTLADTVAWLAAAGVRTSISALSSWLSRYSWREVFTLCETNTLQFMDLVRQRHPDLDEAKVENFGNDFFQLQAIQANNPELFLEFRKLRSKVGMEERKLALEERRVVLLEAKAAQAEATERVVKDADLTPEERARRIAEIYGRT